MNVRGRPEVTMLGVAVAVCYGCIGLSCWFLPANQRGVALVFMLLGTIGGIALALSALDNG